jgi:hypothetical protein
MTFIHRVLVIFVLLWCRSTKRCSYPVNSHQKAKR